ncbi:NACHT domain-containing protein [Streptomyces sp. NPDC047009]|uniref:NACHT domain-containing protein n=1 Tax=Streptomyces sp. NPDC047009 TaxID=3154496 RepID=UPI0033C9C224
MASGAAVLVTGVVFLVADRNGDLGKTEPLTAVLGFGLSMTGLAMSLLREGTTEDGRRSPQERIDRLTGQLAAVVQEQWQAEWRLRRLQDPAPLQVGWALADPWLSDHRENIGGPEDLSARLEQITEAFAQVPSRRLVVLGEPGSGKTVLAVRFTLDLLEHRQPQDAVPVLFPLSNWLPDHQSLQEWMTASLTATYPGATWGRELLTAGRILPVLDGLDEIPAPMQAHAIQRLNAELDADAPVLLTCRTHEYADVVEHGDVFTAAAVVELQPLPIEDVSAYLRRTARPTRGANGQRTTRWDPVLDRLRSHPDEPAARALRQALTSPLMVAMARAAYDDTEEDPAELLAPRFHDVAVLEQHLLDAFVPAAFRDAPSVNGEHARRWLGFLARHLQHQQTRDLAWWHLRLLLPWPLRQLAPIPLLGGVTVVASAEIAAGFGHAAVAAEVMGASVAGGRIGYLVLSQDTTRTTAPRRPRRRPVARAMMLAAVAVPAGVLAGTVGNLLTSEYLLSDGPSWSGPGGLAYAVAAGLAVAPVLAVLGATRDPFPAALSRRGAAVGLLLLRVLTVVVGVLLPAAAFLAFGESGARTLLVLIAAGVVVGLLMVRLLWKVRVPTQGRGQAARRNRQAGRALVQGMAYGLLAGICLGAAFGLAQGTTLAARASLREFPAGAVLHERPDGTRYATTADGWLLGRLPNGVKYARTRGPVHVVVAGDSATPGTLAEVSEAVGCGRYRLRCTSLFGPIEFDKDMHDQYSSLKLPSGAVLKDSSDYDFPLPPRIEDWIYTAAPEQLFTESSAFGLQVGYGLAVISSAAAGLLYLLVSPADTARTSSPLASLRADRAAVIARGFSLTVLGSGILLVLITGDLLAEPYQYYLALWLVWAPVGPLTIGLSAWGWLLTTRLWLYAAGRLPWRLMAFLDDAHRRGVLRQAGAVYQFRHARLQEQLAADPLGSARD